ncbi:ethanolamine ammonia-lyase reactivating factor EutA [Lysinibacillus sp. FSL K6-0057]|uniref:ethanolamine ammonia-lyase reactivating factor EutA n=2 Tax=Bacillaceae TaxID=186817 RepID=UPI0019686A91|nr:ethanolamine ammonia-lyase reactivating factor EutA [Lysinibacillus fusiformis]QSB08745.1 ethanolamine ammonia-lyase reactivating factor EutA [Lysinibacillus fusiformis]
MKTEKIFSAGIDIGTSTTKMVVSSFLLKNVAGITHVPRIEIIEKTVLHQSPIIKTPFINKDIIDMKKIEEFISQQYQLAQIAPSDIATGAIIITGESATKENASEVVHTIADGAGHFLVATAGPDLEGIIAAKGAGTLQQSKNSSKVIANIDIGGGTANIAVMQFGEVIGTCTLHVGGRLIEFKDGKIQSISPPLMRLMERWANPLAVGDAAEDNRVTHCIEEMVQILAMILHGQCTDEKHPLLLGHLPNWHKPVDAIVFTGGVASCIYENECTQRQYDDIGERLAKMLLQQEQLQSFLWLRPEETARATVTGAGTQTTEISGATIQVDAHVLPLKNVPVFNCHIDTSTDFNTTVKTAVERADDLFSIQDNRSPFALYFSELPYLSFQDVHALCQAILQHLATRCSKDIPIIIVIQSDYAKIIGQTIQAINATVPIICIDQIKVETGDYIDIGEVLPSGVVPVVVKTLAFHSK